MFTKSLLKLFVLEGGGEVQWMSYRSGLCIVITSLLLQGYQQKEERNETDVAPDRLRGSSLHGPGGRPDPSTADLSSDVIGTSSMRADEKAAKSCDGFKNATPFGRT